MTVPSENETWLIEAGDEVIQKMAASGSDGLSLWERLVYCLWVADYGMRNAGDLDTASRALERAATNGLSPVRIGVEKSRILVSSGHTDEATEELNALLANGFTSVGIITGDPVLSSMAGQAAYDELVTKMSVQAFPCAYDEKFSEFNYWLGEWDVHVAGGQLVGQNSVEVEL